MAQSEKQSAGKTSEVIFSWRHPADIKYAKNVWWHVIAIAVLLLIGWWSVATDNFLFIIFLVLFYLLILIYEFRAVENIDFVITPDGLKSGQKFFAYDQFDHFFIVYNDPGVKNIYLEFKNPIKGRLVIPLDGQNAVAIREYLLNFLTEDLDREGEPISDLLRRWLRF